MFTMSATFWSLSLGVGRPETVLAHLPIDPGILSLVAACYDSVRPKQVEEFERIIDKTCAPS